MPFAELDKFDLFYETRGAADKPALVLIPGFASGAWIWFRQAAELAAHFRVITFDPRGVAKSRIRDDLAQTVSVAAIAADIKALLDHLKIEKAHVLGASFGGFVAQQFALNHSNRLNKLVLVCTTAGGKNHVKPDLEILRAFAPNPNLTIGEHIRKFLRPGFSDDFASANADQIEAVCRLREANVVPEKVYAAQLTAAFTFDADAHISQIAAPTLIVTGDQDSVVPAANSENLASQIPNAQLKIVKGGGHLFFIEKAGQFNRIVMEFCQNRER